MGRVTLDKVADSPVTAREWFRGFVSQASGPALTPTAAFSNWGS